MAVPWILPPVAVEDHRYECYYHVLGLYCVHPGGIRIGMVCYVMCVMALLCENEC